MAGCTFSAPNVRVPIYPSQTPKISPQINPTLHVAVTAASTLPPPRISSEKTSSAPTANITIAVTAEDIPEAIQPAVAYNIAASYDYAAHHLRVVEQIEMMNFPLMEEALVLINEPDQRKQVFSLESLTVNNQVPDDIRQENGTLAISLPENPGDSLNLEVIYQLNLPPGPAKLGYTKNQTNFGDWYLAVPPFQPGIGWLVHPPASVGEHLVYLPARYEVVLEIENPPHPLMLAASAPYESLDPNRYEFSIQNSRSFAWSISPFYAVASRKVGQISLSSYYLPGYQTAGEAVLEATANAISLYSRQIGEIDLQALSMVQSEFVDGMEYGGLYFLGQEYYQEYSDNPASYLVPIAVHETAHQWFYAAVGNDQAMEPWLDESLCTYLELLYFEAHHPELISWWWQFRVNRFNPIGWVDSTIYQHNTFRGYVDAVYLRGALWMQHFRTSIGDKIFFQGMQNYYSRYQNKIASREDFFGTFRELGINPETDLLADFFSKP